MTLENRTFPDIRTSLLLEYNPRMIIIVESKRVLLLMLLLDEIELDLLTPLLTQLRPMTLSLMK